MSNDYVYDIETYPNIFTLAVEHTEAPLCWAFEISEWKNQSREIIEFLQYLKDTDSRMVGFNNLGFDYPILHTLIRMGNSDALTLYKKAQVIIGSQEGDDRWMHQVNPSDRFVDQIDLYKIHHFDNKARATGLKALEFNMRSDTIQDLPYPVGSNLALDQIPLLKKYNAHDVDQTKKFYFKTLDMIRFREELTRKYSRDFMNHNDTKIGKDYFVMKLEEAGVPCYNFSSSGRTPRQTLRPSIALKDAILPWITFEQPEFTRIIEWLKAQTITETKGIFNDVTCSIGSFTFVFGLGGIHGSIENKIVESNNDFYIIDLDVSSYYPNLAITNRFYPAHLGEQFCDIYQHLYKQRKTHAKGSAENAMLKLALNGVYGDSNNKFSVFYDPLFTMSITLNGQLLLCLLTEGLLHIDGLTLVQLNTDGLTVRVPRVNKWMVDVASAAWQHKTKLQLEESVYSKMFIRDVNNYLAQYEDGHVKRKGCYEYDLDWHQNGGMLVVPKVAEMVLLHGAPIRETVEHWPDIMDFMLRTKVPRSGRLQWGDEKVQNTSRYFVAKGGQSLTKWLPPLKIKTDWRRFAVQSGWTVQVCNDIKDAVLPVDFEYYIQEIEKITLGLT